MKNVLKMLAAGALLLTSQAFAAVLQYQITGTGSGTFNGVDFSDTAFSFTLVGDTANLHSSFFTSIDPLDSASVNIDGLGSADFGLPTRLGINNTAVFFSRAGDSGLDLFDFYVDAPLDLTHAFGPVAGFGVFALDQFLYVPTTAGVLSFNSATNITFSANPVPEPETWAMLIAGAGLTAFAARRRRLHVA